MLTKCQVTDYYCCGASLAVSNIIDFFVNLYEVDMDPKSKTSVVVPQQADQNNLSDSLVPPDESDDHVTNKSHTSPLIQK